MFSILMVLMSIAMFTALTAATLSYLPVDALIAYKARSKAQDGLHRLSDGAIRYIKSVSDGNGNVALPAPGTDLIPTLQPTFAFLPPAPQGMAWSVQSSQYAGLPAVAICLYPQIAVENAVASGVKSAKAGFPAQAMFVGTSCNAVSNSEGAYVTYWVIANHHG
ncbi:hypothetical protein LJR129_004926 [Acidovorax sp. LjRoot129]|uniref:hypothetical protein n=1 Tax=unclassified Acidovorax TaxID=2684926 RepID=UPI003ECC5C9A